MNLKPCTIQNCCFQSFGGLKPSASYVLISKGFLCERLAPWTRGVEPRLVVSVRLKAIGNTTTPQRRLYVDFKGLQKPLLVKDFAGEI